MLKALQNPRKPGDIHPLFTAFVEELPAKTPLWFDGKEVITVELMLEELSRNSPTAVVYAQAMLLEMYELVRRPLRKQSPAAESLDVTAKAADMFAPIFSVLPPKDVVWKTMSGETSASKMIELIQAGHEDGIQFVQGRLYLARDILIMQTKERI